MWCGHPWTSICSTRDGQSCAWQQGRRALAAVDRSLVRVRMGVSCEWACDRDRGGMFVCEDRTTNSSLFRSGCYRCRPSSCPCRRGARRRRASGARTRRVIDSCPFPAAFISAVDPSLFTASTCAPSSTNARTAASCPFVAATSSAVDPSLSTASTCAPSSTSARTVDSCPFSAATINAVVSPLKTVLTCTPSSASARTVTTRSFRPFTNYVCC